MKAHSYNPVMASQSAGPLVSVVIPNYNGGAYLETCLASLQRQTYTWMEILLVDNASEDNSLEIVRRVAPKAVLILQERNTGFAAGVNAGIRAAHGEWIAVLNNDTEVSETWLEESVAAMERHPDAAFLACRILDLRDRRRLYSAGDCFLRAGIGYRRGAGQMEGPRYYQETEIFAACGCAAIYRKSVLEEASGFDEKFFAYLEDVDLALRLQAASYRGYYAPRAVVFHHGGATSGGEFSALAVRLRTRNAFLVLLKSVPARVFWRCLPMILAAQASWLARVAMHARVWSYCRGLAGVLPLLAATMICRNRMRRLWQDSPGRLWRSILRSEAMAREDFCGENAQGNSLFLSWYFRIF